MNGAQQNINDQLYVLSKTGDRVDIDLHLKDFVESNLEKAGLRVMYPVCFDCFDKILVNIGERTKETE